MAFPAVQSSSTNTSSTGTVSVNNPSGLTAGDLFIAWVCMTELNDSGNPPSLSDGTWTQLNADTFTGGGFISWWKIATSTDVSNGSVSFSASKSSNTGANIAGLIRINGHDPVNPIAVSSQGVAAAATTATASGITPSPLQCLFLMLAASARSTTGGATGVTDSIANNNPSWTSIFGVSFSNGSTNFDHDFLSAQWAIETAAPGTSTGNATASFNGSTDDRCAVQIIAIQPPATVTTTTMAMSWTMLSASFCLAVVASTMAAGWTLLSATMQEISNKWTTVAKSVTTWINTPKS